jgi:hypothetical protein
MGLFSRKNSKPSVHSDTLSIDTDRSRLSKPSTAASPSLGRDGNGWATPMSSMTMSEPELLALRPVDPAVEPAAYLRSLHAVRQRSRVVFHKALKNELVHFNVDLEKFADTAAYVVAIIKVFKKKSKSPAKARCSKHPLTNFGFFPLARLRPGLLFHPAVWPVAALRSRWPASHRAAPGIMAIHGRRS